MCIFEKPVPPATLSKAHVIKWIKRDIDTHKQYRQYVVANPALGNTSIGTVEWHDEAIEVFENAVHYLLNS